MSQSEVKFGNSANSVKFSMFYNTILVPRVVSELLCQSSSQKTTLIKGEIFEGVFANADNKFRGPSANLFIVTSSFRFLERW